MFFNGIFFIGHVSIDKIQNVNGSKIQPGGAALYAAVAAKTLFEEIYLVSAVGKDFKYLDYLNLFPQRFVRHFKTHSTKFDIRYNEHWEAHYTKANYGPSSKISTSFIPLQQLEDSNIIHISPLPPRRLTSIVAEIRNSSPQTKISANTWIGYMRNRNDTRRLRELAKEVDFFIVNDSEIKRLTETETLSTAIRLLEAKMLVVTLGEFGALIGGSDGEVQMIPALSFPVEKIVDTTGAGDTWCGAFLAAYKQTQDPMKSVTAASVISSIKCTGWGFSKLLNLRFKGSDNIVDYVIGLREGRLQKRISDYS